MIRRRRNCIAALILSIILALCLICSGLGEEISFDLPADELILSETPETSFGSEPEDPETTEWETVYSDPMDRSLFPDETYDYDLPETEPEETATEPVRPGTLQSQEIIDAQNRAMENLQEEPLSRRRARMSIGQLRYKYPAGKYWNHADNPGVSDEYNNHDHVTDIPCPENHDDLIGTELQTCHYFPGGWQCHGYALKLGYDATGTDPRTWEKREYSGALYDLKAGDIVRYLNDHHTIFVIDVEGEKVTYTECNQGGTCVIRWDGTITKSELSKTFSHILVCPIYDLVEDEYCHCSASPTGYYTNRDAAAPLYGSHYPGKNQIGTIPKGSTVRLTMGCDKLAHVEYNGQSGYVNPWYFSRLDGFQIGPNWVRDVYYLSIPSDNTLNLSIQCNQDIPQNYRFAATGRGALCDLEWKSYLNPRTIEISICAKEPGDGTVTIHLENSNNVPVASYDINFRTDRERSVLYISTGQVNINADQLNNQTISLTAGGYLPGKYSFKYLRSTAYNITNVSWPGSWYNNGTHDVNIKGTRTGDAVLIFALISADEEQVWATAAVNVNVTGTAWIIPSRYPVFLNMKSVTQRKYTLKIAGTPPSSYSLKADYETKGYKLSWDGDIYDLDGTRAIDVNIKATKNVYGNINVHLFDKKKETNVATLVWPVYAWEHSFPAGGIIVPASTQEIGDESFRRIPAKTVKLPKGLKTIGKYAFADCPNLAAIYIPPTVDSIDPTALTNVSTSQLMIYGSADSPAEDFASANGYWFVP